MEVRYRPAARDWSNCSSGIEGWLHQYSALHQVAKATGAIANNAPTRMPTTGTLRATNLPRSVTSSVARLGSASAKASSEERRVGRERRETGRRSAARE